MTHLAASTENLTYACDTHYLEDPGRDREGRAGVLRRRGHRADRSGLGVELDRDALGVLHEQYLTCGVRRREDTVYMRTVEPGFEPNTSCW